MNEALSKKNLIHTALSALVISLFSTIILSLFVVDGTPPNKDGDNNLTIAYNFAKYSIISESRTEEGVKPESKITREPLYPAAVGLFMRGAIGSEVSYEELISTPKYLVRMKFVNCIFFVMLIVAVGFASLLFFNNTKMATAAMFLVGFNAILLEKANRFYTEIPAALFLTLASTLLYLAWNKKSYICSALAGILLACLTYIKAVYFYFSPLMCMAIALYAIFLLFAGTKVKDGWKILRLALVTAISTIVLVAPWVIRNYSIDNSGITFATRGSRILAIRAEYDSLSLKEQSASFIAYTRFLGPKQKKKILGERLYSLYNRNKAESVYRRFEVEGMGNYANYIKSSGHSEQKGAFVMMIKNFGKHLYMTIAFIHRSLFFHDALKNLPALSLPNTLGAFLYVPFYIAALILVILRLDLSRFSFLLLSAYSWGFHAFFSHYIRRYNEPLIPIMCITFVWGVSQLAKRYLAKKRVAKS